MQKLINQMRGEVTVEIEGPSPERFLNLCAENDIAFWGVRRLDETRLRMNLSARGLTALRRTAAAADCSAKRISAGGAPFFLRGLRRRTALWIGLALFLLVTAGTSRYIWEFRVEGNLTISDSVILQNLAEIGVTVGTRADSIEMERIQTEMLLRLDALYWIGVNVSGSRATVTVRERAPRPDVLPADIPCNVVASKPGLIVQLDAFSGAQQVYPGQTVVAGQTLVSGVIDSAVVGARFVHARAQAVARTWRDITAVTPLERTLKRSTGRTKSRNALVLAGRRLNLYPDGGDPFDSCDKIVTRATFRLPGGLVLPVSLVTETFQEYSAERSTYAQAEAETLLRTALERQLLDSIQRGEVTETTYASVELGGLLGMRVTAECLENIALTAELPKAEVPPAG